MITTTSRFLARASAVTLVGGLALAMGQGLAAQDKPFVRLTEAQGRAAMATAIAAAKTNVLTLQGTYQKELRKLWSDYTNTPFFLHQSSELQVTIMGPAQLMLADAAGRLKMAQSPEGVVWPRGVSISISPINEHAQDVVKTIVTRDGTEIQPLQNGLVTRTMTPAGTGIGRTATVHEGIVVYPVAAFDPGGKVQVDAVLSSGRKLSRTLVDRELRKIE